MGARSLFIGHRYRYVWFPEAIVLRRKPRPTAAESCPPSRSLPRRPAPDQPATEMRPGPTRNVRRVFVYPTAPTPTAGSGIDVDKVPASVNAVGAAQIERTDSLNIADALQQQVPGIIISEVTGNPFQPDIQFRGFVASPVAGTPQGLAVYQNGDAHQRGVRRHRQLGPDSDRRDQIGHRRDQQSRLRPQCAGRSRQRADEGWLQLSGRRDQHDGRLVRPHPEFGAMGQADRQFFRLWRAGRIA